LDAFFRERFNYTQNSLKAIGYRRGRGVGGSNSALQSSLQDRSRLNWLEIPQNQAGFRLEIWQIVEFNALQVDGINNVLD